MRHSFLAALKEPSFVNLFVAEAFTLISVNIFNFYLIFTVFSLTKSNTAVAGIMLSFTIPSILFGVFAGAYVDRWNKKYVLLITNIMRAFLLFVLAFFHTNLIVIFVISFLFSTATQFFIPAESPMIPLVVRKERLLSANALFGLGIYGSMLLAFILTGPAILFFGFVKTLFILIFLLLFACIFISLIRINESRDKENARKNVKAVMANEIKEVFQLLSSSSELHRAVFLLALSWVIILVISALAPGYANQVLGLPLTSFPVYFIVPAVLGVLFGVVVLVNFLHDMKKDPIINTGLLFSGASLLLLPFGSKITSREVVLYINQYLPSYLDITVLHLITVIAFLLGFANAFVFVPSNTILQEKTSEQMRGKVYGVLNMIIGLLSLVPLLVAGGLSDILGVANVITGLGVCLLLLGVGKVLLRY